MTNPSNISQGGAQNQERQPKEQTGSKKEVSPAGAGDARTPDKTIGQVKYAAGEEQTKAAPGSHKGRRSNPRSREASADHDSA